MGIKRTQSVLKLFYWCICFIVLFIAIQETADANVLPALLGSFGGTAAILRLYKKTQENPFAGIVKFLKDDYEFNNYITPKLISIIYALAQGACIGSSIGFTLDYIYSLINQQPYANSYLTSIVFSLITLILIRIILEVLNILYKTATKLEKDISPRN